MCSKVRQGGKWTSLVSSLLRKPEKDGSGVVSQGIRMHPGTEETKRAEILIPAWHSRSRVVGTRAVF